jgi:hypothetical protein
LKIEIFLMCATPWQYGNYASFTHDLIIQFPLKLLKAPCKRQNACLVAIKLGGIRPIFHLPIWVASLTYSTSKLKSIIRFLGCWTGNQDFVLWIYIPIHFMKNKQIELWVHGKFLRTQNFFFLKYGSEEKDSSLCKCSIILGFLC